MEKAGRRVGRGMHGPVVNGRQLISVSSGFNTQEVTIKILERAVPHVALKVQDVANTVDTSVR